jgi:hypothetical protein
LSENLKRRDHSENPVVGGRILLKLIVKQQVVGVSIGFVRLWDRFLRRILMNTEMNLRVL